MLVKCILIPTKQRTKVTVVGKVLALLSFGQIVRTYIITLINCLCFITVVLLNWFVCRVGTSIVRPVNSSGKCLKMLAWQIFQKSVKWKILAFMNGIVLKPRKIKNLLLYFAKNDTGINH